MAKPEKIFAIDEMDEGYRRFIEREEIIRCRDCKYARRTSKGKVEWCALNHDTDGFCLNVMDDGFCAWAERDA